MFLNTTIDNSCIFLYFISYNIAWETRKVKIAALNDSKSIGVCIYNVAISALVGLSISELLDQSRVDEIYVATSVCILVATSGTIIIIFLPKVKGNHKYTVFIV